MYKQNNLYTKLDYGAIGERIKEIRGGVSQTDFAKQFGLLQADISRLERGEVANPSPETLINICIAHKPVLNLDWLLTGEEPKYREERKEVMHGHETDPKLTGLINKLVSIYKECTLKDRAEVRGIIEEVYDEIGKTKK